MTLPCEAVKLTTQVLHLAWRALTNWAFLQGQCQASALDGFTSPVDPGCQLNQTVLVLCSSVTCGGREVFLPANRAAYQITVLYIVL